MADVAICYSSDGEPMAGRVAAALAHEGYTIWSEEAAGGVAITERIRDVSVAIVIWSEAARASEWTRAEANYARGQGKLVQASVDGTRPPLPFDPKAVAPLAGWGGEAGHPGWKALRRSVHALSPPPSAKDARPVAAPTTSRPARPRRSWTGPAVLGGLAAIAAASLWVLSGPPFNREDAPATGTIEKVATIPAQPASPPSLPPAASIANDSTALQAAPEAAPPDATRVAPRPSGPRINRRNSENMRLFCERAGRGTPECRTFARRLRNQGR